MNTTSRNRGCASQGQCWKSIFSTSLQFLHDTLAVGLCGLLTNFLRNSSCRGVLLRWSLTNLRFKLQCWLAYMHPLIHSTQCNVVIYPKAISLACCTVFKYFNWVKLCVICRQKGVGGYRGRRGGGRMNDRDDAGKVRSITCWLYIFFIIVSGTDFISPAPPPSWAWAVIQFQNVHSLCWLLKVRSFRLLLSELIIHCQLKDPKVKRWTGFDYLPSCCCLRAGFSYCSSSSACVYYVCKTTLLFIWTRNQSLLMSKQGHIIKSQTIMMMFKPWQKDRTRQTFRKKITCCLGSPYGRQSSQL